MIDQSTTNPWRDETAAGAISADLFDRVITQVLHDSPESTRSIAGGSPGAYISSIVDPRRMQTAHYEYLFAALDDAETRDLIDKLAARVRLVMAGPIRA